MPLSETGLQCKKVSVAIILGWREGERGPHRGFWVLAMFSFMIWALVTYSVKTHLCVYFSECVINLIIQVT